FSNAFKINSSLTTVWSCPIFSINNLLTVSSVMNNLLSPKNSISGSETKRFLLRSKPKAYKNTTAISINKRRMLFQFFISCLIVYCCSRYAALLELTNNLTLTTFVLIPLQEDLPLLQYHLLLQLQSPGHQSLQLHR